MKKQKKPLLSREQIKQKYGIWERDRVEYLYRKQFQEELQIVDIIKKEEIYV